MKWIWRRFTEELEQPDTTGLEREKAEARAAVMRSSQALTRAKAQTPEVQRVSRSLREIRRRNHFAEMIMDSIKGAT